MQVIISTVGTKIGSFKKVASITNQEIPKGFIVTPERILPMKSVMDHNHQECLCVRTFIASILECFCSYLHY